MLTFANLGSSRTPAFLGGDEDRAPETVPGRLGGAQRLRGDSEIKSPEGAAFFERNQPFSLATWFRIDKAGTAGPLIARSGSFANGYRGYLVRLEADGTLTAALHHVAPDDSIEIRTADPMPVTQWRHLSLTYDGSSRAAGLRLFLDGRPVPTKTVVDNLQRSLINSGIEGRQMSGAPLGLRLGSLGELSKESLRDVTVEDFRAYGRQLSDLEVATLATGTDALPALLAAPGAELLASDRARLRQHYLLRVDAAYRTRLDAITKVRGEENTILTAQPSVMAMRELPAARPTFILARGAYDAPPEPVTPGTPKAILPLHPGLPRNRLGLARWLLAPANPLTARVFVNRTGRWPSVAAWWPLPTTSAARGGCRAIPSCSTGWPPGS
ncbi:LamG-like jellyroll fold domain-containing protein [Luteitalea pratensis]|uniref:LamG-like jellyroll fold domain-containing protein n=1 Tax=Luteitalea pratensis TaxID=1855912 RepID=UPI001F387086|nr:LamG-like jellyroll fold domain-containing protein [Luteitalea pratensis]